ncbi:MAG: epoxide hydrolase, soluble (sEH) [Alectoria sarmentosa]|nr:MAG: epoxide hydrolase, soluble (sEH) [Alectoria sarmentosa]
MGENSNFNDNEGRKSGFQSFEHAAADIVLAASFNSSGTRIILCSADHKIRVYNIDQNDAYFLIDQWRGHDAEVQWLASSSGQFFATIGGDNKFKLWREDPSQTFKSGRRFRCIFSQSPLNHVSYVSFGSKTIRHDLFLSLITHDGLLSLLEPADPESLGSWNLIDNIYPFGQHHRGTEARFRLSFHQGEGPSANAIFAGLDPNAISLAVSAIKDIKVYRAIKSGESSESNYLFYEMVEIHTDATINEIAWAPGCLHPYDVIAAACHDGTIRIFQVDTPHEGDASPKTPATKAYKSNGPQRTLPATLRNAPSGIGAGLAGMSRSAPPREVTNSLDIKHEWKQAALLSHDEAPVWKIRWIYDGSALASTGDNGKVHLWKQSLSGDYIEFAETESA